MTAAPLTESYWPADPAGEVLDVSIGELLRRVAAEVPDRTALVYGCQDPADRRRWTYRELLAEAEGVAYALAARFRPGDRIAVWAPNAVEYEFLQLGAALAGLTVVLVNPALKGDEVASILRQSRSVALFVDDRHLDGALSRIAAEVTPGLDELRDVVHLGDWASFVAVGDPAAELPVVDPLGPAQIQYTSGTTGFPKGAVLHHRGLVTNANLCDERSGADFGAVLVNPLPMFHVGSCTLSVIGAIVRRGTHVLVPRFDPALALELIEAERATLMVLVPTVLLMLLNHPDVRTRDLSSLRTLFSGGANVSEAVIERAKQTLKCRFSNGFGMTEAHGTVVQTRLDDSPEDQSVTVGRALPLTELKVADPLTGATVPVGEHGEICLRGYQTMIGYFELPEQTAAVLDAEGWFRTGDLGTMDDRGFLRVVGRLKDMIIRGGENVYPAEVENAVSVHPGVGQVQVVGVPDETWGEQVGAVVQRAEGSAVTGAELYAFCRERLAGFKAPRLWYFVAGYPTTASGKIKKFELREQAAAGTLRAEWSAP